MIERPAAPSLARSGIEAHPVEFTGSGAEYFRVWIVNVLLSIITFGLYTPWARRRKIQYFYSHTQVVGSPLEFVAEQRRMVFGFLVFAAIYLAYQLAAETGNQTAASVMLFSFALLAPFLWRSAMRFRLGATRWRGVRLAFDAPWKAVYLASWPVFAIAAYWSAAFFLAAALAPAMPTGIAEQPGIPKLPALGAAVAVLGAIGLVLTLLCVIRLEYNYRRLMVTHARIGGQRGHWKPVYLDFVKVWLATGGFFLLCVLGIGVLLALVTGGSTAALHRLDRGGMGSAFVVMAVAAVAFVLLALLASLPARAFREARMFQLVWNNTGVSRIARFKTHLHTGRYVGLRLKNMLLTLLTLGLYRPFAVTSEYAAKVESVVLYLKGGADQLVGELVQQQGAFGDAAADAMGLDLIS